MRANNISQHISSAASSVDLVPGTTHLGSDVTNVQLMANKLNAHVVAPLPIASESTVGMGQIATLAEVLAGTNTTKLVTPFTLDEKMSRPNATDVVYGIMRFNTVAERAEASANVGIAVNTSGLWDVLRNKATSSETKRGTMMISTLAAANAGVDDTTTMTPAKTRAAINTFAVTSMSNSTESAYGIVKTATSPVVSSGLHAGFAVSPKGFIETRATQSRVGTVLLATQAQANARTDGTVVLTPSTLPIASDTQYGITALLHNSQSGVTNKALSAHGAIQFIKRTGDTFSGDITVRNVLSAVGQSGSGNALTRKDYVDGQVAGRAPNAHTHNNMTESHVQIWGGPLDRGNFVTSQPWWNFDSLIIESSRDGGRWFNTMEISKYQIQRMQDLYPNFNLVSAQEYYWFGKFQGDGRTFITHNENCYLWRIIGVKKYVSGT